MAFAVAASLVLPQTLMAVPARKGSVVITQPDGSELSVTMRGDERRHVVLSEDGMLLLPDANGTYCYAARDLSGAIVPSALAARNLSQRDAADWAFVDAINAPQLITDYTATQTVAPHHKAKAATLPGSTSSTFSAFGEMHSVVILVEFSDKGFTLEDPKDFFTRWCNEEGFNDNGATGSVRDYFIDQSLGQFKPTFDVYGPVKLSKRASYYGTNSPYSDALAHEMIIDACEELDDEIDFSLYDFDNDGIVDNVYVIYAGLGENAGGGASAVWPHSSDLSYYSNSYDLKRDGKTLNHYACSAEVQNKRNDPDGIGTMVHEFSHVLGLPDLYHTEDAYAGYTPGLWSVLDAACYNNNSHTPIGYGLFERCALGWVEPTVLSEPANIELRHVATGDGAVVKTASRYEYFLFENRQQEGWDEFAPATGLLIWHVDYNSRSWLWNEVNNNENHQGVDIEEADCSTGTVWDPDYEGDTFPGTTGKTEFTSDTEPSMLTWKNVDLETPITDITEAKGLVKFKVKGGATNALESIVEPSAKIACEGRMLSVVASAANAISVVDMAGRTIATGVGALSVELPSSGIFFVKTGGQTTKIVSGN